MRMRNLIPKGVCVFIIVASVGVKSDVSKNRKMAACSFLKRVKWTTELPFPETPRIGPKFSVEGSKWILYLTCSNTEVYKLTIYHRNKLQLLKKSLSATTFILQPSTNKPVLIETSSASSNILWRKTRDQILKVILNIRASNKITVICLFNCSEEKQVSEKTTETPFADLQSLSRKFSTFLKNESFSDVKLKCADRIFSAHKLILASRSDIFAAMFHNKMVESETGVVDIQGIEPEMLEVVLQYMYLGERLDLSEDTARRLYEAADMYAVHDLRLVCSDWMVENQTTENCLDLLVLADEHSDKYFKDRVIGFAAEHLVDLSKESWFTLKEKHPLLVLSVLEKCMEDCLPGAVKIETDSDSDSDYNGL